MECDGVDVMLSLGGDRRIGLLLEVQDGHGPRIFAFTYGSLLDRVECVV